MSSLPGHGKLATVTGGTGYVGGELVRQLLARGYAVRALTRGKPERALPLTQMAQKIEAASRLSIVPVPTLLERSAELDAAVRGADYGECFRCLCFCRGERFRAARPRLFSGVLLLTPV